MEVGFAVVGLASEVGLAVVGYFAEVGVIVAQFLAILELLRSMNDSNFVRAMLHWKRRSENLSSSERT
jgi:hypothetical protein